MVDLEKAAFGMGCFWGPDALFGAKEGVVKTRVGYSGGEKEDPTYRNLGNHTETILVEYNQEKISYDKLLELFWENHDYDRSRKDQYASKIFYMNDEQRKKAEESKIRNPGAVTDIEELETFYVAEDYHQKYRLRHSKLMEEFEDMSAEELRDSMRAAKANAVVAGHLNREKYRKFKEDHDQP
jgi:methionine-S-sulfoxide reductase